VRAVHCRLGVCPKGCRPYVTLISRIRMGKSLALLIRDPTCNVRFSYVIFYLIIPPYLFQNCCILTWFYRYFSLSWLSQGFDATWWSNWSAPGYPSDINIWGPMLIGLWGSECFQITFAHHAFPRPSTWRKPVTNGSDAPAPPPPPPPPPGPPGPQSFDGVPELEELWVPLLQITAVVAVLHYKVGNFSFSIWHGSLFVLYLFWSFALLRCIPQLRLACFWQRACLLWL
jgi:hypothetical protein